MTAVFVVLGLGVLLLRRSRFGRRLQALKDSPAACATIGMDLTATKLGVFALAAGIAGIGGYLFGCWRQLAGQSNFSLINGALPGLAVLLLAVVGGVAVIAGAFVGAALLVLMPRLGELYPPINNLMLIAPGLVGVSLGQNPDGAVLQTLSEVRARVRSLRSRKDRAADVVAADRLGPEEFVRAGLPATKAELTAFDAELGSVREDCGVPA